MLPTRPADVSRGAQPEGAGDESPVPGPHRGRRRRHALVTEMLVGRRPGHRAHLLRDPAGGAGRLAARRRVRAAGPRPSRCDGALGAREAPRRRCPTCPIVVLTGRIDDGIGPRGARRRARRTTSSRARSTARGSSARCGTRSSAAEPRSTGATSWRPSCIAQENARLQRGLLPSPLIETERPRASRCFYRPGSERALLGGDFYDVVQTPTGVHLLIGDVSGHGPDEAALGVALRIAWRALVLAGHPGADVVRGVEQVLLAERHDDERFATIAMVSLEHRRSSRAEVLLCGHPAPLLIRGGDVDELDGSRAADPDAPRRARDRAVRRRARRRLGPAAVHRRPGRGARRAGRDDPLRRRTSSRGSCSRWSRPGRPRDDLASGAARRGGAAQRRAARPTTSRCCSSAAPGWWS